MAKKVQTKAKINWGWDAPENRNGKASRNSTKKQKRMAKKIGFKAILIILLVTLLGGGLSAGVCYFVCRNDCFTIVGTDEIEITFKQGENNIYVDEGVKVKSFGRNVKDKVYIETNLIDNKDGTFTATEAGEYYIIYKVDDIKYGKLFTVERIRLINFVEGNESDIVVD